MMPNVKKLLSEAPYSIATTCVERIVPGTPFSVYPSLVGVVVLRNGVKDDALTVRLRAIFTDYDRLFEQGTPTRIVSFLRAVFESEKPKKLTVEATSLEIYNGGHVLDDVREFVGELRASSTVRITVEEVKS